MNVLHEDVEEDTSRTQPREMAVKSRNASAFLGMRFKRTPAHVKVSRGKKSFNSWCVIRSTRSMQVKAACRETSGPCESEIIYRAVAQKAWRSRRRFCDRHARRLQQLLEATAIAVYLGITFLRPDIPD